MALRYHAAVHTRISATRARSLRRQVDHLQAQLALKGDRRGVPGGSGLAAAFDRTSSGASTSRSGSHLVGEPRECWPEEGRRRRTDGGWRGGQARQQNGSLPLPREGGPSVETGWAVEASEVTGCEENWKGRDDRGKEDDDDAGRDPEARNSARGTSSSGISGGDSGEGDHRRRLCGGLEETASSAVDDEEGHAPRQSSFSKGVLNEKGDYERFKNEEGKDINSRLQVVRSALAQKRRGLDPLLDLFCAISFGG